MNQRLTSCVPAISIGLFAAILLLHSSRVSAARDCIERHPPAYGGHWYYHVNRATTRRCWHLEGEPAAIAPQVETAPQPPQPDTIRLLSSFFSSLFAPAITPQPDPPPAIAQSEPRHEDRASKRRRGAAPRARAYGEAEAKPAPEPKPKPSAAADQADRDALFREYLRWREQQ